MAKSIHRPEYALLIEQLRSTRLEAGVHQADLAAALGRSQSFVSDIENGSRRLDLIELRDVCRIYGIDFLGFVQSLERKIEALPASRRKRTSVVRRSPSKS